MALRVTQQFAEFATGDAESSDLRVTAQWVEVAAADYDFEPDLRVAAQWVEVCAVGVEFDPELRLAAQWLEVCTHNVHRGFTSQLGTTRSTLAGSTLILGRPLGLPAEIQLTPPAYSEPNPTYTGMLATFNSLLGSYFQLGTWSNPLLIQSVPDTLGLFESAEYSFVYSAAGEDEFTLDEAAQFTAVYSVSAADTFSLGDNAAVIFHADDSFNLSGVAEAEVIHRVSDTLSLADEATYLVVTLLDGLDTLALGEQADVSRIVEIGGDDSLLSLLDTATGYRIRPAHDTLSAVDVASAYAIKLASDEFVVGDAGSYVRVRSRSTPDTFQISEAALAFVVNFAASADTLVVTEDATGYVCKVGPDTLAVSDAAEAELIHQPFDTLSLTENISLGGSTYNRAADESLLLTDEAQGVRVLLTAAADTFLISEAAAEQIHFAFDTLAVSDDASCLLVHPVLDDFTVSDEAVCVRDRQIVPDEFTLGEDATAIRVRFADATDNLQTIFIDYDPETYEEIIVILGLQDSASQTVTPNPDRFGSDALSVTELAHCQCIRVDAIPAVAEDSFTLADSAWRSPTGSSDDTLALSDTAEVIASKHTVDSLAVTDQASHSIVRGLHASDTVELGEAVLYYNALEDFLHVYHPFIGAGPPSNPIPPPAELDGPILGVTVPFQLLYPAVPPFTDTLALRAPNLGNRDRFQMNRISRETRGGTLVVFADPMWPKIQTLVLDFSGLTWAEASGLHTFMDAHLGQEIGLLDWEHCFWSGVITKLDDPIVQDGRGCKYSVGFEFEGELAEYLL